MIVKNYFYYSIKHYIIFINMKISRYFNKKTNNTCKKIIK